MLAIPSHLCLDAACGFYFSRAHSLILYVSLELEGIVILPKYAHTPLLISRGASRSDEWPQRYSDKISLMEGAFRLLPASLGTFCP